MFALKCSSLYNFINMIYAPYKKKMYKSQQLKGLSSYSKRKQPTLWHIGLCLSFLAILKNINALGDSVFLPFYKKKKFNHSRKENAEH